MIVCTAALSHRVFGIHHTKDGSERGSVLSSLGLHLHTCCKNGLSRAGVLNLPASWECPTSKLSSYRLTWDSLTKAVPGLFCAGVEGRQRPEAFSREVAEAALGAGWLLSPNLPSGPRPTDASYGNLWKGQHCPPRSARQRPGPIQAERLLSQQREVVPWHSPAWEAPSSSHQPPKGKYLPLETCPLWFGVCFLSDLKGPLWLPPQCTQGVSHQQGREA